MRGAKIPWVLAFLLTATGWALDPSRSLTQAVVDSWSREDGLPLNSVYSIAQTPDGFLWLGTQCGVVRFDGTGFRVFNVSVRPRTS
jgi:ligand-binding sensor domain-containing protein